MSLIQFATLSAIVSALLFLRAWRTAYREAQLLRDERDYARRRAEVHAGRAATWEAVARGNEAAALGWQARWRYAEQTVLGVAVAIAKDAERRAADELAARRRKPRPAKKAAGGAR